MKSYLIGAVLGLLFCAFAVRRPSAAGKILSALQTHFRKYPEEKIYLQTDKAQYILGQTVWYKVYATVYGTPATLSKIVYIQLISPQGKIIVQNKLPLILGHAQGDFQLPDSLPSQIYQLRCFTAWMMNRDDSAVFRKNIFVKNLSEPAPTASPRIPEFNRYSIQFYPEGGDLIDHAGQIVAFKATDQNGLPVPFRGEVRGEAQDSISILRSFHDGMGKFSLVAHKGHPYVATIYWPDSSVETVPLPAVRDHGISLKLAGQTADTVSLEVRAHPATAGQYRHIVLSACQNNGKVATYPLDMDLGSNVFNVNTRDFETGLLRLTIFDDQDVPQAERLVYINHGQNPALELRNDSGSLVARTRSSVTMQLRGEAAGIHGATLSVSVTDADRVQEDPLSGNICSSLLLSDELRGYIYHPGYYFGRQSDSVSRALDLLLMTNGWRHFEWRQILSDEPQSFQFPVEDSLYIAGKIMNYTIGEEKTHPIKLVISQSDSIRYIGFITPDSNGSFKLAEQNLPGESSVRLEDAGKKGKKIPYQARFFMNPLDTVRSATYLVRSSTSDVMQWKESMKGTWELEKESYQSYQKGMLKPVLVRGKAPSKADLVARQYVSPLFEVSNYHDIDLVNGFYPSSVSLFDMLKGRFPGLEVGGTQGDPRFSYLGSATQEQVQVRNTVNGDITTDNGSAPATSMPYFYVDERQTTFSDVSNIPLSDVALIRYLPPPTSVAPFNGGAVGAICVYLKKGPDQASTEMAVSPNAWIFHGFSIQRQFYAAPFPRSPAGESNSDLRETLYWNPSLIADSSYQFHLSFPHSARAKRFRIIAEGMDLEGHPLYLDQVIGNE